MQRRAQLSSARQDEFAQRFKLFQQQVNQPFQISNVMLCDSRNLYAQRAGQIGADYEQFVLNLAERVIELRVGQTDSRDSQQRIQFVNVAVSGDSGIGLADTASVNQRSLASVAALGVNTSDSHCDLLQITYASKPTDKAPRIFPTSNPACIRARRRRAPPGRIVAPERGLNKAA